MTAIQVPVSEQDAKWYAELDQRAQQALQSRIMKLLQAEQVRQVIDAGHQQAVAQGLTPEITDELEREMLAED